MKKFFVILLTALLGLSCLACVDEESKPPTERYDTLIQDYNGVDKCFWEDGAVKFDDYGNSGSQVRKHAVLSTQTEYDMWYYLIEHDLLVANEELYYPIQFEYDETKIEIKVNPNKEHHFILKILQPCDKEKITAKLTCKGLLDENGDAIFSLTPNYITITVSATE